MPDSMRPVVRDIAVGVGMLFLATVLVVLLSMPLLHPPGRDIGLLAVFLLVSGGITVCFGVIVRRLGFPGWMRSLRARLVLMSVLTALLALVNVAFTSVLMFLSSHDLGLLAMLLGFSMGMAILVALSFSEPTIQSIRRILLAVRRMGRGELGARVQYHTQDEVGELAEAFNSMAEELEKSVHRQQAMEKSRRELVTGISHDLRTPLASVRAMMESVNDGVVDDPETIHRYVSTTLAEVEKLGNMVDGLFELSQIDAGLLVLDLEPGLIQDLISDTLETMSTQARAKEVDLLGAFEDGIAPVLMDARKIQRVLQNLVLNAIQHTSASGAVRIVAKNHGGDVLVEVSDTGEGIPAAAIERIFEPAYRVALGSGSMKHGAGLGLSIAKGIVRAHKGRIWVESVVGEGCTFRFTLPRHTYTP
jgi:signal transduction histidine kinase